MANYGPKREVPPPLRKILHIDEEMTRNFVLAMNKFLPFRALKIHYKMLEVSCHGVVWLAGWLAFIWLINSPRLYQMQTNFYLGVQPIKGMMLSELSFLMFFEKDLFQKCGIDILTVLGIFRWDIAPYRTSKMMKNFMTGTYTGLIIDIVLVAVIKAFVRRRRPAGNTPDMFATIGPDIYGFPSGHASRAAFIVYFFISLHPLPIYCFPPLLAWSTSICLSRVLLQRHHLMDVAAGVLLGILEGCFLGLIWLSEGTCNDLLSWISDEKVDGGQYHV